MKPETPHSLGSVAEAEWVEGELVRSLMRTQRNTQWVSLALIPVFMGVLWAEGTRGLLVLWGLSGAALISLRYWVIRRYSETRHRPTGEQVALFRRYRLVWPISALMWGHPSIEHSWYKAADGNVYVLSPWRSVDYWTMTGAVDPDDHVLNGAHR